MPSYFGVTHGQYGLRPKRSFHQTEQMQESGIILPRLLIPDPVHCRSDGRNLHHSNNRLQCQIFLRLPVHLEHARSVARSYYPQRNLHSDCEYRTTVIGPNCNRHPSI